ncbi:hypothetical protein V5799_016539 [Amblyomma americanum]|uniref:Uncharacterized protein n=1 Tax=Amblyomma americanum TaxID=6943 RepID=A0AAQ4F4U9_AMBAM
MTANLSETFHSWNLKPNMTANLSETFHSWNLKPNMTANLSETFHSWNLKPNMTANLSETFHSWNLKPNMTPNLSETPFVEPEAEHDGELIQNFPFVEPEAEHDGELIQNFPFVEAEAKHDGELIRNFPFVEPEAEHDGELIRNFPCEWIRSSVGAKCTTRPSPQPLSLVVPSTGDRRAPAVLTGREPALASPCAAAVGDRSLRDLSSLLLDRVCLSATSLWAARVPPPKLVEERNARPRLRWLNRSRAADSPREPGATAEQQRSSWDTFPTGSPAEQRR